ncbi:hypothetical protein F2Q70_00002205 [Brassica cretica]|nr:hypothetical protein F2Q70_00002205 [Brassica cretica]
MAYEFPKRILEEGVETQIDKINNTGRRAILEEVKGVLKDEYEEVLEDPVFEFVTIIEHPWGTFIEKEEMGTPGELAERVMGPAVWLKNHEIDAMLFLFRERTSLRRWNQSKVAFMSCIFSYQMKNSSIDFKKDRKKFKVEGLLHQYGIGELPAYGRT